MRKEKETAKERRKKQERINKLKEARSFGRKLCRCCPV
jgi:hypothetical protein